MLKVKTELLRLGLTQASLAGYCQMSNAILCNLLNKGEWPKTESTAAKLRTRILQFCKEHDIEGGNDVFEVTELPCGNTEALRAGRRSIALKENTTTTTLSREDNIMLLRRQTMTPAAKKAFGLFVNPFGDLNSSGDMFQSQDIRYVCEHLMHTAKTGGF